MPGYVIKYYTLPIPLGLIYLTQVWLTIKKSILSRLAQESSTLGGVMTHVS